MHLSTWFHFLVPALWALNQHFDDNEYSRCREAHERSRFEYKPYYSTYLGTKCKESRIQILNEIGKGCYAQVYKANLSLDKVDDKGDLVVIANLAIKVSVKPSSAERFAREECLLANIKHPNIPKFYCALIYQGRSAIVMEYIPGVSAAVTIDDNSPPEERDSVAARWPELLAVGASVLNLFHNNNLILKDLKAENVLVGEKIYFIDHNLTDRSHNLGAQIGTPLYWAPEIAVSYAKRNLSSRMKAEFTDKVDWYSLGLILFPMIQGYLPFSERSLHETMEEIVQGVEEKLPEGPLGELLGGLMNRNPDERFGLERLCHWVEIHGEAFNIPVIEECAQYAKPLGMATMPVDKKYLLV